MGADALAAVAVLSNAGLIGALIGFAVGALNRWIILRMVAHHVEAVDDASPTEEEMAAFAARTRRFRRLVLVKSLIVFPIVGYALGEAVD
ncbi:MAG: hypothetical protein KF735_10105 [Chelatococcus sp.]|jgi:cytochrome b561|uniref:hypothetical protein n=1 Tax=unclassified Chelatococcus TaxID=2638111 RepID=UPI001BCD30C4|nr:MULTISPECIES: hypothetical protein [unclassified Chelatococcus]CAH1673596.1 conserved hypothetical protein [Hyphomicrobiales bacterium]MBS7738733.1 hypothetical protein [Chelatococcus sp. HY11]MBX3537981.1 hypothetical protein [Chelatococcus sp.]MBX3543137.1 hypothetical protein [Chelatococcus sp.]MCO5076736.1 hypothetical protein [Chelatococcus sp.]